MLSAHAVRWWCSTLTLCLISANLHGFMGRWHFLVGNADVIADGDKVSLLAWPQLTDPGNTISGFANSVPRC